MSQQDSSQEKTEEPTEKRRRDSRKEGQSASSKEFSRFVCVVMTLFILYILHTKLLNMFTQNMVDCIDSAKFDTIPQIVGVMWQLLISNMSLVVIVVVILGVVCAFNHILQIGGVVLNEKAFQMDMNRLNPVQNAKQIFSKKKIIDFFCNMIEVGIMFLLAYYYITKNLNHILLPSNAYFSIIMFNYVWILLKLFILILSIHFVFSVIYLYLEKRNLHKQLKMTKEDLKKEGKELNGDPEVKSKRREFFQELMDSDNISELLKQSTFVLANPTHIAVLIMYSPLRWKVPLLLLKVEGEKAQLVFRVAKKMDVPIIKDKPLARNLYSYAPPASFIPSAYISDLAEVIAKNIDSFPVVKEELIILHRQSTSALTI